MLADVARIAGTPTTPNGVRLPPAELELLEPLLRGGRTNYALRWRMIPWSIVQRILRTVPQSGFGFAAATGIGDLANESIKACFARHPRFRVRFTPTSASWLTHVERWFASITEKYLRRGMHRSIRQLDDVIRQYLDVYDAIITAGIQRHGAQRIREPRLSVEGDVMAGPLHAVQSCLVPEYPT